MAEIRDCNFYGVKWEASAVKAVQTIADSLLEQARACTNLIEVFRASNVQIDAMVKIVATDVDGNVHIAGPDPGPAQEV